MSFLRATGVIPTLPLLLSGLGILQSRQVFHEPHAIVAAETTHAENAEGSGSNAAGLHAKKVETVAEFAKLIQKRKVRVQRLLTTLDRIAEVSGQMSPEHAAALEPVIVELAEQTLELSTADAMIDDHTDQSLTRLEHTVKNLADAVNDSIEPEMSL